MLKKLHNYSKDMSKIELVLFLGLGMFVIIQALMILYINLFQNQNHLGYDAAHFYLKAIEIARQGTLFPDYYEQTSLGLVSSVPLAALFYKLFGNIFVAFGLANIIIAAAFILIFWSLFIHIGETSILPKLLVLSVFISPFMGSFNNANPIYDPYNALYVGAAFYNGNVFIGLCVLKSYLILSDAKILRHREWVFILLVIILCFLSGSSTGMYNAVTYIAPLCCIVAFEVLREKSFSVLKSKKVVFLFGALVISLVGIKITDILLNYRASDSKNLVGAYDFFKNIGSIYLGYLGLLGGIPLRTSVLVFSKEGVLSLCNFVIANAIFMFAVRKVKDSWSNHGLNANKAIILINLFMFIVCYLTYGAPIFENRYLLPVYISMLILMVKELSESKMLKHSFNLNVFYAAAIIALVFSNVSAWYIYNRTTIADWNQAVPTALGKYDVGLVYGTDNTFIRNLKVLDTNRVYKSIIVNDDGSWGCAHWGDYKHYEESGDYVGKTVLISAPEVYAKLPPEIQLRYVFQENINGNPKFGVYLADASYFDLAIGLPKNQRAVNYPFSKGLLVQNGTISEDGFLHTHGVNGFALFGPYAPVMDGSFTFILHYAYNGAIEGAIGNFDITTKTGTNVCGSAEIFSGETEAIISGISFDDLTDLFEHRVWVYDGVEMEIKLIEIIRE